MGFPSRAARTGEARQTGTGRKAAPLDNLRQLAHSLPPSPSSHRIPLAARDCSRLSPPPRFVQAQTRLMACAFGCVGVQCGLARDACTAQSHRRARLFSDVFLFPFFPFFFNPLPSPSSFKLPTQLPPPQATPPPHPLQPPPLPCLLPPPPPHTLHLSTSGQTRALRISTLSGTALIITNKPRGFKCDQCCVWNKKLCYLVVEGAGAKI